MMLRRSYYLLQSLFCLLWTQNDLVLGQNAEKSVQNIRIINGSLAYDQEHFGYQASLKKGNKHFCGGVIINSNHILTAAHCVYDFIRPSDIKISVGSLYQRYHSKSRTVKTIFVHPGFDIETLQHDLAVLRIESLGSWTTEIRNLSLAKSSPTMGTYCTVAGWGTTEISEFGSHYLRYTQVPVLSKRQCERSYEKKFKRGMFCAGYIQGGPDACQGDSGGGIVCNGELSGIVSWGHNCGEKNYPGVYADVSQYRDWIRAKSGSLKPHPIPYLIFFAATFVFMSLK